jgi:hypothetical protein
VGFYGHRQDQRLLGQLRDRLGSSVKVQCWGARATLLLNHRETLLRLVLLVGGEVRHPRRRRRLARLRQRLKLRPLPRPRRKPRIGWFAGHFTTDGSATGVGLASASPRLVVTANGRSLLEPWVRCWGGALRPGGVHHGPLWHQWSLENPSPVLALAAELRRVYRHWSSAKDRRLALLPLVYALRHCGAQRRSSGLYPYWRQLLGLWQLQQVGRNVRLTVGGRGRLAAARPLAQRLRRSLQRLGQPEGTRWRRLVALWHALPANPALRPGRRWRTALAQTLDPADPLLGPVLAALPLLGVRRPPPPRRPSPLPPELSGPLLAALLDVGGGWEWPGKAPLRLRLVVGPEQEALLAVLGQRLGLAGLPRPNGRSPNAGRSLLLGPTVGLAALAAAALPHCRLASGPPPQGWAAELALPAAGSALAAERAADQFQWALTAALLRGSLTLVAGPGGRPEPQLWLENATWRGAQPERERTLLGAVAAAVGAPEPRWRPTADGRRGSGVWRLVVADGPLAALAEALVTYPLPVGGRWPLLPEALALAALDPADPATADRWAEFRSRWDALPSGRALGGRRKPAPLALTSAVKPPFAPPGFPSLTQLQVSLGPAAKVGLFWLMGSRGLNRYLAEAGVIPEVGLVRRTCCG